MISSPVSRLALAISLSVATTSALASAQPFNTARSFAMGGTGVAVAHPATANIANPAMLASKHHEWSDDFGVILPSLNVRVADDEDVIDQIDDIQDTIDTIEASANNSDVPGVQTGAGELRQQLSALNRDTMRADAGLGLSLAIPMDTVSIGVFAAATVRATVRGNISDQDLQDLEDIENGTVTDVLLEGRNLGDNLSSNGTVLASSIAEFGVSFARSFELSNGNSVEAGVAPKYVQLRTFEHVEKVSSFEDDDATDDENETDDSGFNLDLGLAYAFGENREWNTGLAVRNLIPMDLDSVSGRNFELDPRITAGIAHSGDLHVVTAEIDLTKREAFGYGDDTQWVAVGAEFDAFRYAQLRVGARQNLASNDDDNGIEEDTQFTAGIGLSVFGARVDLAALVSDTDTGAAIELGAAF
ncbi:conjugal transfer protein TraF [Marinobacter sp.]|uniref:conjugal transfer protein TraF n=1 Tax=Marinobacter sp. TaxID=50741 RepID=UPI00384CB8A2